MKLKKHQKKILLTIFSIIFSSVALPQQSSAITLYSNPTDDFTVSIPNGYTTNTATDPLGISRLKIEDSLISFIKFDISGLEHLHINSARLKLHGSGLGSISAYYVSNDSWVNQSISKTGPITQNEIDNLLGIKLASASLSAVEDTYSFDFTSLNELVNTAHNPSDRYFSLALKQDNPFMSAQFDQMEVTTGNGPILEAEGFPNPEPSSMLLGLIGLSGVLGSRRKNWH